MVGIDSKCVQRTNVSNIKFEENHKKIIFSNVERKYCYKIQVDGCVITQGKRCDNLLKVGEIIDVGKEYYVELKGTDVPHAVEQIESTIDLLHNDNSPIECFIIFSNMSPKFTSKIQLAKVKFERKYKAKLLFFEREHQVKI